MSSSPQARRFAKTLAAVAVGSASADAAIVVFDVNPDLALGNNQTWFLPNLSNGTFTTSGGNTSPGSGAFSLSKSGSTFTFGGSGTAGVSFSYAYIGYSSYFYNGYQYGGPIYAPRADRFSKGFRVSGSAYFTSGTDGDIAPTGTFYIGLHSQLADNNWHFGWVELSSSSPTDIKINSFAFETIANQSILTGDTGTPVPEASTLGFAGGLFGLVAAAHLRRRQAKQAAASDKFLALAAGEKLN